MNAMTRAVRWASRRKKRQRRAARVFRTVGRFVPEKPPPKAPIFIVGPPRSGTTVVFNILNRSEALRSLGRESGFLWDMFHGIDHSASWSHEIDPSSISPLERRVLCYLIDRITEGRRYLDKVPRNSLRIPYLCRMFPDAWFVFIKRDGRATVSSMMTGWRRKGRFGIGLKLPVHLSIDGYDGSEWKFLLPPGWQDYAAGGRTLAEVCAFQWTASNEAILAGRDLVGTERWVEVAYETLVESPRVITEKLLASLALPLDQDILSFAEELDRHPTQKTLTPPEPDKWRKENPREVESIVPMIRPMMERLGYLAQ
jgi:Sulfotransferase family